MCAAHWWLLSVNGETNNSLSKSTSRIFLKQIQRQKEQRSKQGCRSFSYPENEDSWKTPLVGYKWV